MELMRDMNTRLYKAEDELATTKTELVETKIVLGQTKTVLAETKTELEDTKTELLETKIVLAETRTDLAQTKTELAETKTVLAESKNDLNTALNDLAKTQKETKTVLMKKNNELESEITRMRNPPYMHACGYQGYTYIKSATIPYSTLLYSSTNTEGGGLDIASGVFTSSWPGSYTITWSLQANNNPADNYVYIYLQHNGHNIQESEHFSFYSGVSGTVQDQGIIIYTILY